MTLVSWWRTCLGGCRRNDRNDGNDDDDDAYSPTIEMYVHILRRALRALFEVVDGDKNGHDVDLYVRRGVVREDVRALFDANAREVIHVLLLDDDFMVRSSMKQFAALREVVLDAARRYGDRHPHEKLWTWEVTRIAEMSPSSSSSSSIP